MRFHHRAPAGWINDPYGLTWHEGRYHLFFQHVPDSTVWQPHCHWGHATSNDLLTWTPEPIALAPGDGDDGCWSGSVAGGVAFYTSVRTPHVGRGTVRRAVPLDAGWRTWEKQDVVVEPPPEAVEFRDPFVHRHGGGWRMLVGGTTADHVATAWAYTSPDLVSWTGAGIFASRSTTETDGTWTGDGWECPQLVEVEGREVLVVSVWSPDALHHVAYRLDGRWHQLSHGGHYAAAVFTHADGRPGLVTWLRDVAGDGWTGATSLPMSLSLDGDRLVAHPPPGVPTREGPDGVEVVDGGLVERYGRIGITAGPVSNQSC